ncbi:Stress responsive alpha-beta barrel domain protein [Vibrio sp. MEBiC08052]|nr:Stress responsive alpha-beta barrel domain protein [Vibrio sp. MEBiC08052]
MILHVVLFTFKKNWSWSSTNAIEAEQATRNHPRHIEEIKGWICGRNISRREIAADFIAIGIFNNTDDLEKYIVHPNHREGVEKWKAIAEWNIVDIDLSTDFSQATGYLNLLSTL